MPRPAGRIEQPNLVGTEGLDGGCQRAIEDEPAHEVGRLAQGEAILYYRIQLLVEIAHQLAFEVLVGKAPGSARVRVALPPETNQRTRQLVRRQRDLGGLRAE